MTTADAGPAAAAQIPVPEHVREAARLAPDHWIGVVDPAWGDKAAPPEWAVLGHWRSDEAGETEEFLPNPEYRPSPQALGWAAPTDAVDAAVQLAATGYGPGEDVVRCLTRTRVAVPLAPDGQLLAAVDPAGTPVVLAFTAGGHWAAGGRLGHALLDLPGLLERLPEGHGVLLNPTADAMLTVNPDALRAAVPAAAPGGGAGPEGTPAAEAPDVEEPAAEGPTVEVPDVEEPTVEEPTAEVPDAEGTPAEAAPPPVAGAATAAALGIPTASGPRAG
ncbi:type VII secretion system-associated protein [Kitasatospora sp. NPDC089797]|uniref:type VII secretion system-associated protein n=1 Tax=Kitasatospora sp. NPDC089797 TaxID=3155298 RepID=UPI00343E47B3